MAQLAVDRALELPGVKAAWISLREGEAGFRLAAARGLPPGLAVAGAMEGDCLCRRLLRSGELTRARYEKGTGLGGQRARPMTGATIPRLLTYTARSM